MLRHDAGAPAEDRPGQERAQQRVSDAGPGRRDAVAPSELARVTHEHDRGKVRSTERKCGEPGAHGTSAENEAVHVCGMAPAVDADRDHHHEENDQKREFESHNSYLLLFTALT